MTGIAIFLICFFIACWVLVLGHHFGPPVFDSAALQFGLPAAYVGAMISVGVLAVAVTAVVIRK